MMSCVLNSGQGYILVREKREIRQAITYRGNINRAGCFWSWLDLQIVSRTDTYYSRKYVLLPRLAHAALPQFYNTYTYK